MLYEDTMQDIKELCTNEIWAENDDEAKEKFIIGFSENHVHYIAKVGHGMLRAEKSEINDFKSSNHYVRDSKVCTYHLF